MPQRWRAKVCSCGYLNKGQFHVEGLFPGKLNFDGDLAERTLNQWFKTISRALNLNDSAKTRFS